MSRPPLIFQIVLIAVVAIAAIYDMRFRRIPNWLVLAGLIIGIGLNAFLPEASGNNSEWKGLVFSLKGFAFAFVIYFPLYLLRGMGAGDVKLMAAIGSIVGWRNWLGIFIITAIVGGLAAVALLVSRKRLGKGLSNVGYLILELLSFRPPFPTREEPGVSSGKTI